MSENTMTRSRVQLHAHVEPAVRDDLAKIARANDRSLSAEIRRALAEHVARERTSQARSGGGMSAEARRELLRAEQALPEHTRHFDPPPAAEDVFPALRRHMKRLRELREKQAAYEADARRLADERFAVEAADREQLGLAVGRGKPAARPAASRA